ncbi:MAG: sulfotransferase [Crocosphaera sp.]
MKIEGNQIKSAIIEIIEDLVQSQDIELDDPINLETTLVAELDLASMDFIQLVVAIEDHFQQKLGFHDLLMSQGDYVDDITVGNLVNFVEKRLNSEAANVGFSEPLKPIITTAVEKISDTKIKQFRNTIENRIAQLNSFLESDYIQSDTITTKNKKAIFVLSPPRSGSTLLRIILAGHPQLFAPPELHLLSYKTLKQRKKALDGDINNHLLQGAIRGIIQLKDCTPQEAEKFIQDCEEKNLTTQEFYHLIQQDLGDRMLVDKTPTYASHLDILKRAEQDFDDPIYIHLLRHPYGMIRSYETSKLERIVPIMNEVSFTRKEVAELTWLISQENILDFFQSIPQERKFTLKFEDLVDNPAAAMTKQCQFLGLEFYPEMLDIYQEKQQRMTDGVYGASEMSGDLKFHLHKQIESDVAYSWKKEQLVNDLGDKTWEVANALGYYWEG